jgi:hypothetical protein
MVLSTRPVFLGRPVQTWGTLPLKCRAGHSHDREWEVNWITHDYALSFIDLHDHKTVQEIDNTDIVVTHSELKLHRLAVVN